LDAFRQFAAQSQRVLTWQEQHGDIFNGLENVRLLTSQDINNNIKIAGEHNRRNATLLQIGLNSIGISQNTDDILSNFPGTNRRFEKLADNLYSDYGHHPAEIAATLQMASELSNNIVLVYQPHQNSRQHAIKDQYTDQFEIASDIYWLPTHLSAGNRDDNSLPILEPADLIKNITNKDHVHIAKLDDTLWDNIQAARSAGKLVLVMGAGAIDKWARERLRSTES
jgi:UDP-N-acetylmuramate--alanine ligase